MNKFIGGALDFMAMIMFLLGSVAGLSKDKPQATNCFSQAACLFLAANAIRGQK